MSIHPLIRYGKQLVSGSRRRSDGSRVCSGWRMIYSFIVYQDTPPCYQPIPSAHTANPLSYTSKTTRAASCKPLFLHRSSCYYSSTYIPNLLFFYSLVLVVLGPSCPAFYPSAVKARCCCCYLQIWCIFLSLECK
ncbi:hypothetical protein CPC08DRAFT_112451 [Agrocybe pediades]|nr:hypothetical protein CPC08DRAFT_112451 [Agrocybe pediades]